MRIINFNKDAEEVLAKVAEEHGVDKEKLWDLYLGLMRRNYFDDLCDIARENKEELGEE